MIELQLRQPCIQRIVIHQLLMRTQRHQLAVIDHRNPISVFHRGQAVRDNQCGASRHQAGQGLLYQVLTFGIQRTGGLIEQQDRRIHQQRPGNCQSLTLPPR